MFRRHIFKPRPGTKLADAREVAAAAAAEARNNGNTPTASAATSSARGSHYQSPQPLDEAFLLEDGERLPAQSPNINSPSAPQSPSVSADESTPLGTPRHTPWYDDTLKPGANVMIYGLSNPKAVKYNGKYGKLIGPVQGESGDPRWQTEIADSGISIKVKAENLTVLASFIMSEEDMFRQMEANIEKIRSLKLPEILKQFFVPAWDFAALLIAKRKVAMEERYYENI